MSHAIGIDLLPPPYLAKSFPCSRWSRTGMRKPGQRSRECIPWKRRWRISLYNAGKRMMKKFCPFARNFSALIGMNVGSLFGACVVEKLVMSRCAYHRTSDIKHSLAGQQQGTANRRCHLPNFPAVISIALTTKSRTRLVRGRYQGSSPSQHHGVSGQDELGHLQSPFTGYID